VWQFIDASHGWLKVSHIDGLPNAVATWRTVRDGHVAPDVGYIVRRL